MTSFHDDDRIQMDFARHCIQSRSSDARVRVERSSQMGPLPSSIPGLKRLGVAFARSLVPCARYPPNPANHIARLPRHSTMQVALSVCTNRAYISVIDSSRSRAKALKYSLSVTGRDTLFDQWLLDACQLQRCRLRKPSNRTLLEWDYGAPGHRSSLQSLDTPRKMCRISMAR